MRLILLGAVLAVAAAGLFFFLRHGPGTAAEAATPGKAAVAVELFTSQSCSSCPPAEAYLGELAKRADIVALEWHVDYWDGLQVAGAGKWKDPFSSYAWTQRQQAYNVSIRRQQDVYTPQMIINGAFEATGLDHGQVTGLLNKAATPAGLKITASGGAAIKFDVEGAPAGTEATLVSFAKSAATKIGGGENHGRMLANTNVVLSARELGSNRAYTAPQPAPGAGCALLLHAPGQGRILAAAYCPA
jgi:hypothetical protein